MKTFAQQSKRSNQIMFSVIIISMLLLSLNSVQSNNRYMETTASLSKLNTFYDNVELSTAHLKSYLYTENPEMMEQFKVAKNEASTQLNQLKEQHTDREYRWHLSLLANMFTTYGDIADELILEKPSSASLSLKYNEFLEVGDLIEQTAGEYYKLTSNIISNDLNALTSLQTKTIVLSLGIFTLLSIWIYYHSKRLTTTITAPISKLLSNVSQVGSGTYQLEDFEIQTIEIAELNNAINRMASAVESSITTTQTNAKLEKEMLLLKNEALIKEELLTQSELKMLQNQINPHFLFNTLNMVYKLALAKEGPKAAEMLLKTTELLRYGLDNTSRLSNIDNEIAMIRNYIEIQEMRLGNRVRLELTTKNLESIQSRQIPAMILQPLVENALIHGLKDFTENGLVEINVYGSNGSIYLSVSDNGTGMNSNDLEELILSDYALDGNNSLGLYNVIKRLEVLFGECVRININSELDCGFEIMIAID